VNTRRIFIFISVLFFFTFIWCSGNGPVSEDFNPGTITFLDSGKIFTPYYLPAILTRIKFANDSVNVDTIQGDNIIRHWTSIIKDKDNRRLWDIVRRNNIAKSPDPVLPEGAMPAIGFGSMTIIIEDQSNPDTILIRGSVYNPDFWSPGLRELVAFKDSLIAEYKNQ
jgi:hypothetical protein